MDEKEKTVEPMKDEGRPKSGWGTSSCPWFIFGNEDAAEYDLNKIKKFFDRFKKKQKHR